MSNVNTDIFSNRLEEMLPIIQQINEQFKDPVMLSYYEIPENIFIKYFFFFRIELLSYAFVLPSFCHFMKQNGWFKSFQSRTLTHITLLSISYC